MSDLLTEVDEALKQERMEKLWKEHGNTFLGFIAMIILGTAMSAGYKSWSISKKENDTSLLVQTISNQNYSADSLQKIIPELKTSGVETLTQLALAGKALEQEDAQSAHDRYTTLSENKNAPEVIRELASYMATTILPEGELDAKLSALNEIAQNPDHDWRLQAALDFAVLIADKKQDYKSARQAIQIITDAETQIPNRLSNIARALEIFYGMKESQMAAAN